MDQERTLCALCCISFSKRNFLTRVDTTEDDTVVRERLVNFCDILLHTSTLQQQSGIIDQEAEQERILKTTLNNFVETISDEESGSSGLSVCARCYATVTAAVTARSQADTTERVVKHLKMQLLEQIRLLESQMEVFYVEMTRIERTVKNSEESYLRHSFTLEQDKHGVFLMRAKILDVIPSFRASQTAQYGRLNLEEEEIVIKDVTSLGGSGPSSSSCSSTGPREMGMNETVKLEVYDDSSNNYFYEGDEDPPMEFSEYSYSPLPLSAEDFSTNPEDQLNGLAPYHFRGSTTTAGANSSRGMMKRGRGRPRKNPPKELIPPRPRGRPRTKTVPFSVSHSFLDTAPSTTARAPIIPRNEAPSLPLKRRGRPRTVKRRGRPRTTPVDDPSYKGPPGRPKKQDVPPVKTEHVPGDVPMTPDFKRARGRPRKFPRYPPLKKELVEVAIDPSHIMNTGHFDSPSDAFRYPNNLAHYATDPWISEPYPPAQSLREGDGVEQPAMINTLQGNDRDKNETLNFFQVLGLTRMEGAGNVLPPPSEEENGVENLFPD